MSADGLIAAEATTAAEGPAFDMSSPPLPQVSRDTTRPRLDSIVKPPAGDRYIGIKRGRDELTKLVQPDEGRSNDSKRAALRLDFDGSSSASSASQHGFASPDLHCQEQLQLQLAPKRQLQNQPPASSLPQHMRASAATDERADVTTPTDSVAPSVGCGRQGRLPHAPVALRRSPFVQLDAYQRPPVWSNWNDEPFLEPFLALASPPQTTSTADLSDSGAATRGGRASGMDKSEAGDIGDGVGEESAALRGRAPEPKLDPWDGYKSKVTELDGTSLLGYNHDRSGEGEHEHEHEHEASS
mmetsp:Transcript_55934/g.154192  ORF Transcript_55934/g.154192 Transcript_55934/m.154192 type:complete len:299 (-) Transcript_55934:19-915(-)|eukprot:CAMPEP_0119466728 /NCGR_PEP_ID=MMETSP1344-20130328/1251_1 /TAXON_ID=236787 /ORGANISM="Florenciella parvula, Strain CCMP2471" /LENGTH=298 /DNA_ID=CAMNT_0007499059 /DNA_START=244 /DNA_END=1140 /DNA_ORIENTATION=+